MSADARGLSSTLCHRWKRVAWSTASILSALLYADARADAAVDLNREVAFSIPSQPLDAALIEFSRQADVQLAVSADALERIQSPGIKGKLPANTALTKLLSQSRLEFYTVGNTVTVAPALTNASSTEEPVRPQQRLTAAEAPAARSETRSSTVSTTDRGSSSSSPRSIEMDEVVVSAEKRDERLQDVPVPVSAISADTLVSSNQLRLQDYFNNVPGLSITPGQITRSPEVTIRGLSTGPGTAPTVGVVVDDVPYGSSTALGLGYEAPDFDPSDLARVEVLRGPQGTFYGASSMGGLLKFVTVDPSTERVSGRIQGGISDVRNGESIGYNVRGAVNVPLTDTAAIRASAFGRRDPGYIDDLLTGQDGVNRDTVEGGRLSALWKPNEDISLKLSALLQHEKRDGGSDEQFGLGEFQQKLIRGTGSFDRRTQAYSANFAANLGPAKLTVLSGYNISKWSSTTDYTFAFGGLTEGQFGTTGTPFFSNFKTTKYSEEARLSLPIGQKLEWLIGAFYTHESSTEHDVLAATDPLTGANFGTWLDNTNPSTYTEYAAFTDLTVHFTDQFDVQFGGRESQNKQGYRISEFGPFIPLFLGISTPAAFPEINTKDNSFTYLVTPRFKFSQDLMVYARFASGYRPGGPNLNTTAAVPPSYSPDRTQNYEIGLKADALEHRLTFDASVYYIDWKDIQLQLINPVTQGGYFANAGRAKSEGVELSVQARPMTGTRLSGWVVFNDAVLTEGLPSTSADYGADGDRLPFGSRVSGNLSADQDFIISNDWTGFVGASVSYVGSREGPFTLKAAPQRQVFPAYFKADLRAGVRYDTWSLNLFVNNLADRRVPLTGGLGTINPGLFYFMQPRTAGLSVAKTF